MMRDFLKIYMLMHGGPVEDASPWMLENVKDEFAKGKVGAMMQRDCERLEHFLRDQYGIPLEDEEWTDLMIIREMILMYSCEKMYEYGYRYGASKIKMP